MKDTSMTDKSTKAEATKPSRRDVLAMAATAAPAAAIGAATMAPSEAKAATAVPQADTRLQDTTHTRQFFDTARF